MGNMACCEAHPMPTDPINQSVVVRGYQKDRSSIKHQPVKEVQPVEDVYEQPPIQIPGLYTTVRKTYEEKQFLNQHFEHLEHVKVRNYGSDVYEGQINEDNRPHGFGKMYKQNGSLFLGRFQNGKANGNGAYIFPDGSYYDGNFLNNEANDNNGHYVSEALRYNGGFQHNSFHGHGQQIGTAHHFKGSYNHGKKSQGKLQWKEKDDNHSYEGHFNDHEHFQGYGILKESKGCYSGYFVHGLKEGKGVYKAQNGLTYDGDYRHDKRNGYGIIYNEDGTIAYQGQVKDGMPHGKGKTYSNGVATETNWVEGIDERVLQ